MFPLYSDRPVSRFPFVTLILITANITVFWFQFTMPGSLARSAVVYGLIPAELFRHDAIAAPRNITDYLSVVTSIFTHGGFLHLGSNMLYLWVFGRNVEDFFGPARYLVFYLSAGILASLAFAFAFPSSTTPLVGASGAIAGVLGVYFLRYPLSRVYCLFILIIFIKIIPVPAFIMLGLWFAIQIAQSMTSVAVDGTAAAHGGVAWISHVAGFVVGIVWTLFELRRQYYMRKGRR